MRWLRRDKVARELCDSAAAQSDGETTERMRNEATLANGGYAQTEI